MEAVFLLFTSEGVPSFIHVVNFHRLGISCSLFMRKSKQPSFGDSCVMYYILRYHYLVKVIMAP